MSIGTIGLTNPMMRPVSNTQSAINNVCYCKSYEQNCSAAKRCSVQNNKDNYFLSDFALGMTAIAWIDKRVITSDYKASVLSESALSIKEVRNQISSYKTSLTDSLQAYSLCGFFCLTIFNCSTLTQSREYSI